MPALANINICTGCTACASVCPKKCIEMRPDEFGFSYPFVDEAQCAECGLCSRVCPVLNVHSCDEAVSAYAAYCTDEDIRMESSSGGVFTALASAVIERGGTVWGAAYDAEFNVIHIRVDEIKDLGPLRGAKYAQSVLGDAFKKVKEDLKSGPVLFSGTPCQVAGLRAYVGEREAELYCVDFICHGVPSSLAWSEYVKYRAGCDCGGVLPEKIDLRSKETGWSRYEYSNLFEYENGIRHSAKSNESPYMQLFVNDYISRKSCEACAFKGMSRLSDITLGDFWGVWDIYPELDDNKGVSAVITHTKKGRELLLSLGDVAIKEVTCEEIARQNGSLLRSSASKPEREEVLSMIRNGRMPEVIDMEIYKRKAPPKKVSLFRRALQYIKRKLS